MLAAIVSCAARGGWEGEQPDGRYTPERRLVSFGLNKIAVEFER